MTLIAKHISYWQRSAKRSWETTYDLYRAKRYDACLFFCHLTIEKTLKALAVLHTRRAAPYTHNLIILARVANIALSHAQEELLRTITTFNISGRYDDYKFQFYKKATLRYTKRYLDATNEFYLWLQKASSPHEK